MPFQMAGLRPPGGCGRRREPGHNRLPQGRQDGASAGRATPVTGGSLPDEPAISPFEPTVRAGDRALGFALRDRSSTPRGAHRRRSARRSHWADNRL
jgi:hypothetical protein